jgi:amino acid adenylation domain-containing protein
MADGDPVLVPVDFDPFAPAPAESLPLTEAQREMWTAAMMGREANCSYNQCFAFELEGPLDAGSLRAALAGVVARHEALRVTIAPDGSAQTIGPPFAPELPGIDLGDLGDEQRSERIAELLDRECETPFDLAAGPLVRAFLVHEGAERHRFVLTAHHIVCDGWSSSVLFSDLGRLYVADRIGLPAQLPPVDSYRDFVVAQTGPEHAAEAAEDERYWTAAYSDSVPVLELPVDRPRPAAKTYDSGRELLRIDAELHAALRRAGAASGATLFATLVAAYEVLLHRLTGQAELVVGIPLAGQPQLDLPRLVAHCVNTVPLRAEVDPGLAFRDYLRRVASELADAQDHSRLTFGSLVRELGLPRDRSRTPLVSTTFTIDRIGAPFDFGEVRVAAVATPKEYANFELALNVVDSGSDALIECDFNSDLFDAATLRRWLSHYETLLRGIVADPTAEVAALPLLADADRRTILAEFNATAAALPDEKRLHRLFEQQARTTPDAIALIAGEERVSYAELNARANRLGHRLRRAGVGPGSAVGVCLDRSAELLVALLAVLKAGGAYVPLDPAYPPDRLAFMLSDSRALLLVTEPAVMGALGDSDVEQVLVERGAFAEEPDDDLEGGAENTDLAYVIYTSGSTGVPKGVAIEHRSAGTLLHWARTEFSDHELAGMLAATSVCFDLSVFELFLPLAHGGTVILADNALALPELPARDSVTLFNGVPSAAAELVRADAFPASVETVCLAGELLPTRLVDQLYGLGHVRRVVDLYGPSEDTTYSTYTLRKPGVPPTIGRPIANTRAYVLDARGAPVPIGVTGELYLAGDGLARGYLHRPELTAEKFVTGAWGGGEPERAYRTGDLARYLPDGTLVFLGRNDHQVKVRGFRVEPGEIEAALARQDGVGDVVVVVREDRPGDKRLVAYVTAPDADGLVDALRAGLRRTLPGYMVPSQFVVLAELPMTPNGKVDRKALPVPDVGPAPGAERIEPRTATEARIAAIWDEALGAGAADVNSDFFDVGGDSLKAAQVMTRLRASFGVDVGMRHLFEEPTIAGLATLVDLLAVSGGDAPAPESGQREEAEF